VAGFLRHGYFNKFTLFINASSPQTKSFVYNLPLIACAVSDRFLLLEVLNRTNQKQAAKNPPAANRMMLSYCSSS
jgi:hypothetical protein